MKRFLKLLFLVPAGLVLLVFAVANRHGVSVSLDPFDPSAPALSVRMPLFILLFLVLALGVLIGGTAAWLRQGRWRRVARNATAEMSRLRRSAQSQPPPPPAIGHSLSSH